MEKNKQQTDIITDNFVSDIRTIIEQGRKQAYAATGQIAIMTYWNIGRRIVEEEQQGASRAAYGQKLIPALAVRLAAEYGTGYGKRNLAYYRKFYLEFKDVEILHTRVQNLTWSHVRRLLSVSNTQAREWYLKTAAEDMWSVDDLDRNISTQYYERRLAAQRESSTLPVPYAGQTDPLEYKESNGGRIYGFPSGHQLFRIGTGTGINRQSRKVHYGTRTWIRFCGKATAYCDRYG